jgi:hypothetical protein
MWKRVVFSWATVRMRRKSSSGAEATPFQLASSETLSSSSGVRGKPRRTWLSSLCRA